MSATDPDFSPGPGVTLDEIDETLDRIAAKSSFSSNKLRAEVSTKEERSAAVASTTLIYKPSANPPHCSCLSV